MLNKLVTVLVIAAALLVQSVAYSAMACDMHSDMNHDATKSEMMMDHMDMADHTMSHDAPAHDCCESDCVCPMSACSSFIYLSTKTEMTTFKRSDTLSIRESLTQPIASYYSLYRPPIIA